MNSLQSQAPATPILQPLKDAWLRWWNTLYCQTNELWQTISSRDTGKIYKEAIWKTWQILTQLLRLLLLLAVSVLGIVLFVWLLGFHGGRGLRAWLEADSPTPARILRKLVAVFLLPFQLLTIAIDQTLKEAFGWDLKLTQLLPPLDPELLPASKQPAEK